MSFALELTGITKRFGALVALREASIGVRPGTVHALVGENGAGKTTLMRVAFGLIRPDTGRVTVRGNDVQISSPAQALALGIGMVHQHFSLVPAMSVAENIALGQRGTLDPQTAVERVEALVERTGLIVPAGARIADLPVGAQQRVEILKALARDVSLLILDEPTAVLSPTEADELLRWMRAFARGARAVVLITHKLREAQSVADDVTVLRGGRAVLSTEAATVSTGTLVEAMLGEATSYAGTPRAPEEHVAGPCVLRLSAVNVTGPRGAALTQVSMEVHGGEIVGVAAVEASGHHELLRVLAGRLKVSSGGVEIPDDVAFVPEDRHRDGAVLDFSLTENIALRGLAARDGRLSWTGLRTRAVQVLQRFDVRAASPDVPFRTLSGGNQQRVVLARELDPLPLAVVAENPTRGLDVKATVEVHARLREARAAGAAVVLYSSDVDEVLAIADRVVVVHAGRVRVVARDRDAVGRAILGVDP